MSEHDVPRFEQTGDADCYPSAAASCLKWFQQTSYPDLQTHGGSNAMADIRTQLSQDAGTDERGTFAHKLIEAINNLIDTGGNGIYKGRLRAKLQPDGAALRDFAFLDREFARGQNIIICLKYGQPPVRGHAITTRDLTGSGDTRTLSFMDPATGTNATTTVTREGGKLKLTYDGEPGFIDQIIHVSPAHTTRSSFDLADHQDASAGWKLTYRLYFPPEEVARDLHIWTNDCNPNNWDVRGLPAGWRWTIRRLDGKCYVSIYKDHSTVDLVNGASIEVIYSNPQRLPQPTWGSRCLVQTTSGTAAPDRGASPADNGFSMLGDDTPGRPRRPACAIVGTGIALTVGLRWSAPSAAGRPAGYEVYDLNTGALVTSIAFQQNISI